MAFVSAHSKIGVLQAVHILGYAGSTDLFFKDVQHPLSQILHLKRARVMVDPITQLLLHLVKYMLNWLVEIRRVRGDVDPLMLLEVHPLEVSTSLNPVVIVAEQRLPGLRPAQVFYLALEYCHVVLKLLLSGGCGLLVGAFSLMQAEKCTPRCMSGYGRPCRRQAA